MAKKTKQDYELKEVDGVVYELHKVSTNNKVVGRVPRYHFGEFSEQSFENLLSTLGEQNVFNLAIAQYRTDGKNKLRPIFAKEQKITDALVTGAIANKEVDKDEIDKAFSSDDFVTYLGKIILKKRQTEEPNPNKIFWQYLDVV